MATYTSAASGLWSAGATWVGGVKPPSGAGHKIVIAAGHVVEYDEAAGEYGDDTSSATPANNAIVVNGTLKASRSVSTSLTCRGTLQTTSNSVFDYGTEADPIPSGVTATLLVNFSAALAIGKHVVTTRNSSNATFTAVGANRKRNTRLTNAISAGATSITVDDSTGWAVGDRIVIASPTDTASTAQVVVISGGSSPTWTVPAIAVARAAGCRVGNLTSNVTIGAASAAHGGAVGLAVLGTSTTGLFHLKNVRFSELGNATAWSGIDTGANFTCSIGITASRMAVCVVEDCAFETVSAPTSAVAGVVLSTAVNTHIFRRNAVHMASASATGFQVASGATAALDDNVIYRAVNGLTGAGGAGCALATITGGEVWATTAVNMTVGNATSSATDWHGSTAFLSGQVGGIVVSGGSISAPLLLSAGAVGGLPTIQASNVTFGSTALTATLTAGNVASFNMQALIAAANGTASDNRLRTYYLEAVSDTSTRRRDTYSVKMQPKVASTSTRYDFRIPAVSGVAQVIKGSLRFDATYGTANPPSIALSGQGVTASFTAPATADAWHDFTLSFTPTGTGDITATVTVQSTSTSGFAWLDGIYHFPMIQSVRHFGYQWLPQAAQIVDSRITLTEAAALALPVAVNHGTSTITVTGAVTAREVFEACMADLVQTANQGQAVHIESAAGETFETTYTVALSGAGAISGVYTDAAGVHVTINVPGLIADTRVYLRNMTDGVDIDNVKLTSTGYTLPVTWTADKTIRLRAGYAEGAVAKLPIEATGVLTNAGLTFIVTQEDDAVYNELGIDGGTITEFTPDIPNVQIDISDPDGETSVQRLYVWTAWIQTSSIGIVAMFRAMSASDTANYVIDQDIIDAKLDNVGTNPVRIIGGYLSRKDGSTLIVPTSNSIQIDPGKAYLATGGSLTSEIEAGLSGQDMLRIILAAVSGRTSGVGTDIENYLSVDGSKPRITSTFDGDGNRLTVDVDGAL